MRRLLCSTLALASLALPSPALAEPPPPVLLVPAGPGQQAMALRVESSAIRARICASAAGCSPDGGVTVALPEGARVQTGNTRMRAVMLAGGRMIAHVEIAGEAGAVGRVLIAAPLDGKDREPVVLWSGVTGAARGEHGEERSQAVIEDKGSLAGGATRVLVGEHRADVTICGRPALVSAREIDPQKLELVRATAVPNLGAAERAAAAKISAARASGEAPKTIARLLRATAASSALGKKLGAITDGDVRTAWSENKVGDGRGEHVSLSSAEEVAISALDVVVRPTEEIEGGAAPKRVYLATPDKLFEVNLPEDAWRQPAGTRYAITLPVALRTSCLSVVLDASYAPANQAGARVSIAEISARTAFDGASAEALAGALAGGGERAMAAAALLSRSGEAGTRAAVAVYDKLDDQGRRLAAQVIDAAPCKDQVAFFAERFAAASAVTPGRAAPAPHEGDPELIHARDRLRRCGRPAAEALAKLVRTGAPRTRVAAAEEISALAPEVAVPALLDAMGSADDAVRRDLRAALARAARSSRARAALGEELSAPKLGARSEIVAIDLLRAAGPALGSVEGAADAFATITAQRTSFRARFLLQAPAAELARAGDARAAAYLRAALQKDQDAFVRARAAAVSGGLPALGADLIAALDDADPRVREAVIAAVAEARARGEGNAPAGLAAALGKRLAADDWTFVRAGAARALGALPAEPGIDGALAAALRDVSPEVRGRALDGLGAHRATAHLEAVRDRQDDDGEHGEVRARAILALGAMCDRKSIDAWTKLALGAKSPIDERSRVLGGAAIAALGDAHPADLATRLAPLLEKDAPGPVREMARAALAATPACR